MTTGAQYLTGSGPAIAEFIDKFDVSLCMIAPMIAMYRSPKSCRLTYTRHSCSIVMVCESLPDHPSVVCPQRTQLLDWGIHDSLKDLENVFSILKKVLLLFKS